MDSRWQPAPGTTNDSMILDDEGMILRLAADRGEGRGFYVSGPGHSPDDKIYASKEDAMTAAEETLTERQELC
jgi:hypothetical protein